MKNKYGHRNTAFWIGLILVLSMLSTILFANVSDSNMPMYEEGAKNEQRETD